MDKTIEITEQAQKVIVTMRDMLSHVRHAIGENDPMYVKMAESLAFSLTTMLGLGGRITSDGDCELYCVGPYLTYGVNFHSKTHPNKEIQSFDIVAKNLGEWSVNS